MGLFESRGLPIMWMARESKVYDISRVLHNSTQNVVVSLVNKLDFSSSSGVYTTTGISGSNIFSSGREKGFVTLCWM